MHQKNHLTRLSCWYTVSKYIKYPLGVCSNYERPAKIQSIIINITFTILSFVELVPVRYSST